MATSILAFTYGSRKALGTRKAQFESLARYGKPLFAGALVLVGFMILSGVDKIIEAWMLELMPMWLIEFTTRF